MKRVILPLLVLFGLSMLFALESDPSDVVGYIQYTIDANNYGMVALPFGSGLTMASELAAEISPNITTVVAWSGGTWQQHAVGYPGTDFAVADDNSYLVANGDSNPVVWYAEGTVGTPAAFDIVGADYTQIMLPLDCSDLTLASELASDIGTDVTTIVTWSAGTWAQHAVGYPGTDFAVEIGGGYLVYSNTAYTGWNGSVRNAVRVQTPVNSNVAKKEIKE